MGVTTTGVGNTAVVAAVVGTGKATRPRGMAARSGITMVGTGTRQGMVAGTRGGETTVGRTGGG